MMQTGLMQIKANVNAALKGTDTPSDHNDSNLAAAQ